MLWIIQSMLFSIILITTVHYLYLFFLDNLTTPIIKDLLYSPINKYEQMYSIINNSNNNTNNNTNINHINTTSNTNNNNNNTMIDDICNQPSKYNISDLLPSASISNRNNLIDNPQPNMKDELKNFLKEQLDS